jgi:hypothetical protein
MLADRRYCYPLTITDFASRYLFACEALSTTKKLTPSAYLRLFSTSSACPRLWTTISDTSTGDLANRSRIPSDQKC